MRLVASGAGYAASDFATGVGPVIDLVFGPYGSSEALYYTVWNGNVWRGAPHRRGQRKSPARCGGEGQSIVRFASAERELRRHGQQ